MSAIIAVAGATGNLGFRIVNALIRESAEVWALVRPETADDRIAKLEAGGAKVVKVDLSHADDLKTALSGAATVVSALQGLRPVIIDTQTALLQAAIAAGVSRFIPSDYAADFTKTAGEANRNFELRRDFHAVLAQSPIAWTSVLNGMFMDLLAYGMPMFDLKGRTVTYWGDPDQRLDFTTMDDTAAATARVALDQDAPPIVRVAGDQLSPKDLAALGSDLTGLPFQLIRAGSIAELGAAIEQVRVAHPGAEGEEFPRWQQMQYTRNMFSGRAKLDPVDNARFPDIKWTRVRDLAERLLARQSGG
ncbi:MAG: aromatic alcohol reductase [Cypionkella sp.]